MAAIMLGLLPIRGVGIDLLTGGGFVDLVTGEVLATGTAAKLYLDMVGVSGRFVQCRFDLGNFCRARRARPASPGKTA
jgi:hypothetical protein